MIDMEIIVDLIMIVMRILFLIASCVVRTEKQQEILNDIVKSFNSLKIKNGK